MDAEYHEEQKLTNEVIYLHSLWHQGPPSTTNPPTGYGSANINVVFGNNNLQDSLWRQTHHDQPAPSTRFDCPVPYHNERDCQYGSNIYEERKRKDRDVLDIGNVLSSQSDPVSSWDSGLEWPCRALESRASKVSRIMSEEEHSRHMAWEMQYKVFDSCREFFRKKISSTASDSDGAVDDEDDEDDDDMDVDVSEDCAEYKFFLNVFVEDCELRSYYEKNYKCGDFICLVCGGTGKKNAKKRFKDGIALVQHSLTISNTLKRKAHRAFGKVISKVLGWDVDRLPAIVLKGYTLGKLLEMKQREAEGIHQECAVDGKDNVESCEETSNKVLFYKDYTEAVDGSCNTENNDQKILNSEVDKDSEENKVGNKRSEDDLRESLDVLDESIVYVKDVGGADEQQSSANRTSIVPILSEDANKMSEDKKESLDVLEGSIVSVNDIGETLELPGVSAVNQTNNALTLCEDSNEKIHMENDIEKDGVSNEVSMVEVGYNRSEDDPNESSEAISVCIVSANNVCEAIGQGASAINQTSNALMISKVGHKMSEYDPKESLDVLHECIVSVNNIGSANERETFVVNQIITEPVHSKVRKMTSEGAPEESLDVLDECNAFVNDIGEVVDKTSSVNQTSNELVLCEDSLEDNLTKNDTDNNGGNNELPIVENSNQSPVIESKWLCEMPCDDMASTSGWPATKPHLIFPKYIISPEEQANAAALQLQQKVLASCKTFFVGNPSSDIDEEGDDDTESSEDEEETNDNNTFEACEEFKFLLKLFTEKDEIRRYYENHYKEGNFFCLVCGGIGKKSWKTFKGCIGLLQHANSILKTEKKRAHRSYVQVICKLLGWDFDRLPAIVSKGQPLGFSLAKSSAE